MVKLNSISFENDGKRVKYDYAANASAAKYFHKHQSFFSEYDVDVSAVPPSILVIPFLANFAPVSWFAGFDIFVDELDSDFYDSLQAIRSEMAKYHPQINGSSSKIKSKLVENHTAGQKSAMLFSGGVDAFTTYFRHFQEKPDLITIQGADIELSDSKQWEEVKILNANEPILKGNEKHYIATNLTAFYTYEVDLLLPNLGWWGNIQHGLALICALAPLSYLKKYSKIYIASTRSSHMEFNPWGSMPETDEKIYWAGLKVIHDGFELKRQDKVDVIVDSLNKLQSQTTIRVCYSELKTDLNCSECEKCIRTIFGIVLAGGNPNHYGFKADENLYNKINDKVSKGFKTRGTQFFWSEILEKSYNNDAFYVFSDFGNEKQKIQNLQPIIRKSCESELAKASGSKKIKLKVIKKYPELFNIYLKIRRKL